MRIYLVTDLEGVCGVMNFAGWCMPESRYYEMAKQLLTAEVNAAIEGFLAGGATEVAVLDGHGYGGIRGELLHPAAELMRVWPGQWPFLLDERAYDGVAWVGQHAKAGTPFAHLAHTGNFDCRDDAINTTSVGEFGRIALCAGELGIRVLFASGDRAFTEEAQALAPGVETVAVKRGTAHDFTMSADLVPGTTFCGRARLVVRNIGQFPQAAAVLDNAWQEFCNDLHLAGHCSAHPPPTRGDTGGHVAKQGEGPTVYEQEHD